MPRALLALLLGACEPPVAPQHHDLEPEPSLREGAVEPSWDLRFNELQADNDSSWMSASYTFPDWVELFNAGSLAVDLSVVSVQDASGNRWEGMEGVLRPGEHLLLQADGEEGDDHLPFSLSAEGERLELAVRGLVVDRIATGPLHNDLAWARFPDGGAWQVTSLPTPGRSNGSRPPSSDDPSDRLFQADRVQRVQLTIPAESWASLEDEPYLEVPGGIFFEGAWFPTVGVRIKGQLGSLRTLDQKAALKVDLNEYEDRELRGLAMLTLNNMVQDPSFVHEHLAHSIWRAAGIPAPRVGWTWLEVNGEPFGLYLLIESIDERFLARWYADPDGHLYEGSYGQDFDHDDIWGLEYDEGPDPEDRAALEAVADVLDAGPSEVGLLELRHLVDVEEFMLNMAIEAHILHWDGYTTQNNWRFYLDPVSGRFQIIPWGADQTFVDYWYEPWEGNGRVFQYCLAVPSCEARYREQLLEVADLIEGLRLQDGLDPLVDLLWEHIEADPRRECSLEQVLDELEATRETLETYPAVIRAMVEGAEEE